MAFNHQQYIKQFLGKPGTNDAARLGVTVVPGGAGITQARCIGVHALTGDENRGMHNVFLEVLDEVGERIPSAAVAWTWYGREGDPLVVALDKPPNEPAGNYALEANMIDTECWVLGTVSDHVKGLTTRHPDEPPGNTYGHWSYYVVFQVVGGSVTPTPEPTEPDAALDALRMAVAREIAGMRGAIVALTASLERLEDAID
jgi:hypothetical protein